MKIYTLFTIYRQVITRGEPGVDTPLLIILTKRHNFWSSIFEVDVIKRK